MNIAICDDNERDLELIAERCSFIMKNKGIQCELYLYKDASFMELDTLDILLLDVKMPGVTGLDIKNKLEFSGENKPLIIFITGYPEYSVSTHGRNVIGFLEKPLIDDVLELMLVKAAFILGNTQKVSLGDGQIFKLIDIQYFYMDKGYTKAVLKDGYRSIGVLKTLSQWEDELKENGIIQMFDGTRIKISRREVKNCKKMLLEYKMNCARYA